MIAGIKIWQEPHGGWTAACYNTAECRDCDWSHVLHPPYHKAIRQWMDANAPTASFSVETGLAEFGYDDRAAENALLFKMKFQG